MARAARQRGDGRWELTDDAAGTPVVVGFCAGRAAIPDRLARYRDEFHTDGHATRADAEACFRRYLLASDLRLVRFAKPRACLVCGIDTPTGGGCNGEEFALCTTHRTRTEVESRMRSVVGSNRPR